MVNNNSDINKIWEVLENVTDPEIPVVTIRDLGIIRDVKSDQGQIEVIITPTYSGCPAMNMIEVNIKATLQEAGYHPVKVTTVLKPAWTTDWMTEEGKKKLQAYGIAPPLSPSADKAVLFDDEQLVPCPQCKSTNTILSSQFGSTACKSLFKCLDCLEPFDYFKCHR